jgi:hypothetical protein
VDLVTPGARSRGGLGSCRSRFGRLKKGKKAKTQRTPTSRCRGLLLRLVKVSGSRVKDLKRCLNWGDCCRGQRDGVISSSSSQDQRRLVPLQHAVSLDRQPGTVLQPQRCLTLLLAIALQCLPPPHTPPHPQGTRWLAWAHSAHRHPLTLSLSNTRSLTIPTSTSTPFAPPISLPIPISARTLRTTRKTSMMKHRRPASPHRS